MIQNNTTATVIEVEETSEAHSERIKAVDVVIKCFEHNGIQEISIQRYSNPEATSVLWYYLCYALTFGTIGILWALPSALFTQIAHQLDITDLQTSYVILCRNIGYIASCLATAFVLDKFKETHKALAVCLIGAGISCSLIPFTTNYWMQCLLWAILGISTGTVDVTCPVYVFRKWRDNPTTKLSTFQFILSGVLLVTPLLIELSISLFDDYCWSMLLISVCPVLGAWILMKLPTPLHDAMRSIEAQMKSRRSSRDAKEVQVELEAHHKLKSVTVTSLFSLGIIFAWFWSGTLIHITVYCEKYLTVSSGIGRFLIASFCCGQVIMRIAKGSARGQIELYLNSSKVTLMYLWIVQFAMMMLFGLWIIVPLDQKVPTLFVIFAVAGGLMGDYMAAIFRLIDSVTPVMGRHTCFVLVLYALGELLIVIVNGAVMDKYGVKWYPFVLLIGSAIGIPIMMLSTMTHRAYRTVQGDVMRDEDDAGVDSEHETATD